MTALLPTTGHADLIKFAAALPDSRVHVLISGRSFEPLSSLYRWQDLHDHFKNFPNVFIQHSVKDAAPQNPEDMPEGFWEWWREEINRVFPEAGNHWKYVVASEPYGQQVADSLGARFMPYDIARELNPARGSDARRDPWTNWQSILPETRARFMLKATMFGQESVGKTTLSRLVSEELGVNWIPEYARPYLETVGEEVTITAMENIHAGQAALQKSSFARAANPALILDTDLFSTVGYYEIMDVAEVPQACIIDAKRLASDVYYVLPDDIPFEEDILRYGGDHRESERDFWIDLLKKFNQTYEIVPMGFTLEEKVQWIAADIRKRFDQNFESLKNFQRELPTVKELVSAS
jgi:HTH-type transcriptional repressor of NAD biosynthesis genes